MIFIFIGVLIMLYGLVDYKNSFLCFLIFNMFLTGNINLISIGSVSLTLNLSMTLYYVVLYIVSKRKKYRAKIAYPFRFVTIYIGFSMLFSAIFAWAGFTAVINRTISDYITQYIHILLIWHIVETDKDYKFLIKWITIVMLFSTLYAFVEYVIKSNPLMAYEISLVSNPNEARNFSYATDEIRGYRSQSIFESAIGAGINWILYTIWILTMSIKLRYKIPIRRISYITAFLCILASFFAKSRSPIVFLLIGCLCFFEPRNKKFYALVLIGAIGLIVAWPVFLEDFSPIILSLFSSQYQAQVSGSNILMRLQTLDACWEVAKQSPIFGVGLRFDSFVSSAIVRGLRGMESVWFVSLVYYGFVGVFGQLWLAFNSIKLLPDKFNSKPAFFLAIAYWVTYTMTTLPGMLVYMYYLVYFFFIKNTDAYRQAPSRVSRVEHAYR